MDSTRDSILVAPGLVASRRAFGAAAPAQRTSDLLRRRPAASLLDLVGSGLAGVDLARAGGTVGIGGRLRIRGATSLLLSADPLILVDGIRVDGTSGSESVAFAGTGARPSRIDDFDPAEVGSIEVLSGPAAAALFGGDAANGVILITTKRPESGRTAFDLHANVGASWLADPEGRFPTNYYVSRSGQVQGFDVLRFNESGGLPAVFSTGVPFGIRGSMAGGSDRFRYYLNADGARDRDYFSYSSRNRYGGRANLTYTTAGRALEIDLSAGIRRSHTRSPSGVQPITTSIVWACNFPGCEPAAGPDSATTGWNGPGHGYQFYRPEDYALVSSADELTRTTVVLSVSSAPTSWFHQRLTAGPDLTRNSATRVVAPDPTNRNPFFGEHGTTATSEIDATRLSVGYAADASWHVGRSIAARTSIGAERYSRQLESLTGVATVNGPLPSAEFRSKIVVLGADARQEIAWRNRIFLTAGLRVSDDRIGDRGLGRHTDQSLSASVLALDRSAGSGAGWLSRLRFRGAWGRVGRWPADTLPFQISPTSPPLVPETTNEVEAGFDAELFSGRVGVGATWYHHRVDDAFVPQLTPPSRGLVVIVGNGATIQGSGVELDLVATPIRSRAAALDLTATIGTSHPSIRDLVGNPRFLGATATQQWDATGFAPGSFFYRHVVSAGAASSTLGGVPVPVAVNPMCEGGADMGLGNGTVVPCAGAPRLYAGQPTPTWFGSASATISIHDRLRLFGLVDYRGGNSVLVGDVEAMHTFFLSSKETLDGSDPILLGYRDFSDPSRLGRTGLFKAGFARLRTISVEYQLPKGVARWVGTNAGAITVAVDNLAILWREQSQSFGVGWIDPEVLPNGGTDAAGLQAYTQDPLPLARRVTVALRFTL
jgi:TonB-dependent SusC/RagA subfamily outer membrane receptor